MDYAGLSEELCRMHFDAMPEFAALGNSLCALGESGALLTLYRAGRPMLSGEFVEKMGLTTGRVANILRRLEEKGLIERQSDREDGRHVLVLLTGAGRQEAQARYARFADSYRDKLAFLGEEDAQAFARILGRLLVYVRKHPEEAL